MKNFERYKSSEERYKEFIECLKGNEGMLEAVDLAFSWLELESEEENPLPCPFCGNPTYVDTIIDFKHVACSYCGMKSPTHKHKNDADAIAEYNRVVRAVMAAKEKEAK